MNNLRLGFHYHVPAILRNGGLYMPGYLGRFVDSLADICDWVTCFLHSPRPEEVSRMDYRLLSGNVRLVDIGIHTSVIERAIKSRAYTSFLRRYASEMDILLVRGPSPLLPAMVTASPVPTALLLVGDYLAGVDDLPQPRWRKEAIRLWSFWNRQGQNWAARHTLTFVNSRVLYDEMKGNVPNLHEVRTTTLTKDDFFIRTDTCQSKPYRLLYVGRIDRAKGLLQIVEAVALLTERGEEVTFDFVGWAESGDSILEEIQALANAKNIIDKVHYLGSRPLGPELFECYKQSDIFVTASLSSEGFPRSIWEAMAHSLPVVATDVGAIRHLVGDSALIVPPNQPTAISEAVSQLIHDSTLRSRISKRGFQQAQAMTLEVQSLKLVQFMSDYIQN